MRDLEVENLIFMVIAFINLSLITNSVVSEGRGRYRKELRDLILRAWEVVKLGFSLRVAMHILEQEGMRDEMVGPWRMRREEKRREGKSISVKEVVDWLCQLHQKKDWPWWFIIKF